MILVASNPLLQAQSAIHCTPLQPRMVAELQTPLAWIEEQKVAALGGAFSDQDFTFLLAVPCLQCPWSYNCRLKHLFSCPKSSLATLAGLDDTLHLYDNISFTYTPDLAISSAADECEVRDTLVASMQSINDAANIRGIGAVCML